MGFGPNPFKIPDPISSGISPPDIGIPQVPSEEFLGVSQIPEVNVASTIDQAKDAASLPTSLGIDPSANLDSLGSLPSVPSLPTPPSIPSVSELGSGLPGPVPSIPEVPTLSSAAGTFPDLSSATDVALGVPDFDTLDPNAFGGGYGLGESVPAVTELPASFDAPLPTDDTITLGSALPSTQSINESTSETITGFETDTEILEAEEFVIPPFPNVIDGGDY